MPLGSGAELGSGCTRCDVTPAARSLKLRNSGFCPQHNLSGLHFAAGGLQAPRGSDQTAIVHGTKTEDTVALGQSAVSKRREFEACQSAPGLKTF